MPGSRHQHDADYGPRRLTVELGNICNLHCRYCLRDEDALYSSRAEFLALDLFARALDGAIAARGIEHVTFTGGEPTLHPQFAGIVAAVAARSLTCSFVTNGWHFERVWPVVDVNRKTVTHVAFSLDGATREAHDGWRGTGSFDRVVRAMARCWSGGVRFDVKVVLRRDTVGQIEACALFAAKLGAAGIGFAHVMPTPDVADDTALSVQERTDAEREIAQLARILRMRVSVDVGYWNTSPEAPCSPLARVSGNRNFRGELTLCCNLSGYRGASHTPDVVGSMEGDVAAAFARLDAAASGQAARRVEALRDREASGTAIELRVASPCLFCLDTLGKVPASAGAGRHLPVVR